MRVRVDEGPCELIRRVRSQRPEPAAVRESEVHVMAVQELGRLTEVGTPYIDPVLLLIK